MWVVKTPQVDGPGATHFVRKYLAPLYQDPKRPDPAGSCSAVPTSPS